MFEYGLPRISQWEIHIPKNRGLGDTENAGFLNASLWRWLGLGGYE